MVMEMGSTALTVRTPDESYIHSVFLHQSAQVVE
jgi:hypothetical protein